MAYIFCMGDWNFIAAMVFDREIAGLQRQQVQANMNVCAFMVIGVMV